MIVLFSTCPVLLTTSASCWRRRRSAFNELLVERFAARGFREVRASYGSVLVPLFERDGLRLGELAGASRLSKQAMTGLVKRCEADGLVERERDPADGRAFTSGLPHRGQAFQAVAEEVLGELDAQLARVTRRPQSRCARPSAERSDGAMRSETVTTVLDAPQARCSTYMSDIEQLPEWATEFARELRREGDDYKVVNGLGEFYFTIAADADSGVIDMFAGPTKDAMAVFPTRAVGASGRPHRVQLHDVPGTRHAGRAVRGAARVAAARVREHQAPDTGLVTSRGVEQRRDTAMKKSLRVITPVIRRVVDDRDEQHAVVEEGLGDLGVGEVGADVDVLGVHVLPDGLARHAARFSSAVSSERGTKPAAVSCAR